MLKNSGVLARCGAPTVFAAAVVCFAALPASAATATGVAPTGVMQPYALLNPKIRRDVVTAYADILEREYARADEGHKMAAALRDKLRTGSFDRITSPYDFARALQADARAVVDDRHLRVGFQVRLAPQPSRGSHSPKLPPSIQWQAGAISDVRILDGNIGYLAVNAVPPVPEAKAAIESAFAFLHDTRALIIDLRGNGGGDPATVARYMSYLSSGAPYVVNTVHFRKGNRIQRFKTGDLGRSSYGNQKPVFALISSWTFSGGEELAYDLKAFKRGIIVGRRTGGGANPGRDFTLGNGFLAFVPIGYAVNPVTHGNWEHVGVVPDVTVSADMAVSTAWHLAIERIAKSDTSLPDHDWYAAAALAKISGRPSIQGAVLAGTYGSAGGPEIRIGGSHGSLSLGMMGRSATLEWKEGDCYALKGLPLGYTAIFVVDRGKPTLLLIQPRGLNLFQKT